jgi:hypothetical protein
MEVGPGVSYYRPEKVDRCSAASRNWLWYVVGLAQTSLILNSLRAVVCHSLSPHLRVNAERSADVVWNFVRLAAGIRRGLLLP